MHIIHCLTALYCIWHACLNYTTGRAACTANRTSSCNAWHCLCFTTARLRPATSAPRAPCPAPCHAVAGRIGQAAHSARVPHRPGRFSGSSIGPESRAGTSPWPCRDSCVIRPFVSAPEAGVVDGWRGGPLRGLPHDVDPALRDAPVRARAAPSPNECTARRRALHGARPCLRAPAPCLPPRQAPRSTKNRLEWRAGEGRGRCERLLGSYIRRRAWPIFYRGGGAGGTSWLRLMRIMRYGAAAQWCRPRQDPTGGGGRGRGRCPRVRSCRRGLRLAAVAALAVAAAAIAAAAPPDAHAGTGTPKQCDTSGTDIASIEFLSPNGSYKIGETIDIRVIVSGKSYSTIGHFPPTPSHILEHTKIKLETGSGTERFADSLRYGQFVDWAEWRYTVQAGDNSDDLDYDSTRALYWVVTHSGSDHVIWDTDGYRMQCLLPTPGGPGSLANKSDIRVDGIVPGVAKRHRRSLRRVRLRRDGRIRRQLQRDGRVLGRRAGAAAQPGRRGIPQRHLRVGKQLETCSRSHTGCSLATPPRTWTITERWR